jgi:hypothetical protein
MHRSSTLCQFEPMRMSTAKRLEQQVLPGNVFRISARSTSTESAVARGRGHDGIAHSKMGGHAPRTPRQLARRVYDSEPQPVAHETMDRNAREVERSAEVQVVGVVVVAGGKLGVVGQRCLLLGSG